VNAPTASNATPLDALAAPFAWISTHPWAYPALEVVHIAGIALLLGNLVLLELRVWGLGAELPVQPLARLALTLSLLGFALVAASGLVMFASQPQELLANRSFLVKMGLIALAGLNAAMFHSRGGLARLDGVAKAQTLLSLVLWFAAIIAGRWIAYV
jgi:hypothetical protein